ncbi:chemotaxis protein CheA [Clostridium magnum]|uniref:Chemotaxis protein CheA n=1 Tax=Clostridium magnum DSM 2767 TaxID=1121326 RepID=A0A161WFE0_9CLOT|nr:chemotaxis protein CheA [Clostridium magnum]KZL90355.1 chemotaxis protein CheA [Clostridium magnum DSM 2767]SHH82918.1 two-component system, chemotaxis family, sensor kinase CheA [Clostridium magnum DSM 2767]
MSEIFSQEPMLDMFIFETTQLIEQLEQTVIKSEKLSCYTESAINEIFRIMHTIKGSSAMMLFENISSISHAMEDMFYFIREERPKNIDCLKLTDIVLEGIDFIKIEVDKIISGKKPEGDASVLMTQIKSFLSELKQNNLLPETVVDELQCDAIDIQHKYNISKTTLDSSKKNAYKAVIYFEEDCEMEDIHAFTVINTIKDIANEIYYLPDDISDCGDNVEIIRKEGFKICFKSDYNFDKIHSILMQTVFLRDLELSQLEAYEEFKQSKQIEQIILDEPSPGKTEQATSNRSEKDTHQISSHQNIISVNVWKLDKLMDLIGELVISEAMVIENPDLDGVTLDNFQKASRQLQKITSELQDIVMSIRMVPLSTTFQKMNRIVRDMCKKLDKEVELKIMGEETEVDKNIIDHISDPLMHIIRNSIDHGIESAEERRSVGKSKVGTVTLEGKNAGGDVLIIIKDNGRGLNKEKILQRAGENGLVNRPENKLTDKEIYSYIFLPGFSTKEKITEFSGRGVGMDVVTKNIGTIGGVISVDSTPGEGTVITLKIPLTLAIINGMTIRVGQSRYTVPIINIKESFKAKANDIIRDTDGNEMILIRGQCHPILRLHELHSVETEIVNIPDGIILMVENEGKSICIFADELLGENQVVVKALPNYFRNFKKIRGLAGCTLLGDGGISLILDISDLINY